MDLNRARALYHRSILVDKSDSRPEASSKMARTRAVDQERLGRTPFVSEAQA